MSTKPSIKERYISLVPPCQADDIEKLSQRSVSAASTISQLSSTTSSTDEYIDAKIQYLSSDLKLSQKFKEIFHLARKRKALTESEYNDAIQDLKLEVETKARELTTLK